MGARLVSIEDLNARDIVPGVIRVELEDGTEFDVHSGCDAKTLGDGRTVRFTWLETMPPRLSGWSIEPAPVGGAALASLTPIQAERWADTTSETLRELCEAWSATAVEARVSYYALTMMSDARYVALDRKTDCENAVDLVSAVLACYVADGEAPTTAALRRLAAAHGGTMDAFRIRVGDFLDLAGAHLQQWLDGDRRSLPSSDGLGSYPRPS